MLVFLRVYACVYVPYMAMHALRVAVGIGGLRLESIFERVAHQPALAGGMCALHTKFVRFLIKTSNTLLYDYPTVSMTPPPSQEACCVLNGLLGLLRCLRHYRVGHVIYRGGY